jgi:hypothetical protein
VLNISSSAAVGLQYRIDMDAHTVDNWMAAYVEAWRAPGTDSLAGIFSPDITYSVSPFKTPMKGLKALAEFWEKSREPDEEFTISHQPVANEGDTVVIKVDVRYKNGDRWRDLWVMQFDAEGLCFSFEEWPFSPTPPDGHEND